MDSLFIKGGMNLSLKRSYRVENPENMHQIPKGKGAPLPPIFSRAFVVILLGTIIFFGTTPHPVTVTTRIIPFLIGNPYKPSFVTVTGWGVDQRYFLLKAFLS